MESICAHVDENVVRGKHLLIVCLRFFIFIYIEILTQNLPLELVKPQRKAFQNFIASLVSI